MIDRLVRVITAPLRYLSQQEYFTKLVVEVAIIYGVVNVFVASLYFYGAFNAQHLHAAILNGDETDLIGALSAFITVMCSAVGSYEYWVGRHSVAFKLFEAGLLVEIFVGQVVLFFKSANVAIAGLFVTLLLLGNLKLLGREEKHRRLLTKKLP